MITRVWGEINGVGAVPTDIIGDKFYFKPPQTLTGRFVCQFWAEDDFGNVTNLVAVLTLFKGMIKCIEVLSREWSVTMLGDGMRVDMDAEPFEAQAVPLSGLTAQTDPWEVMMLPAVCDDNMIEVVR